MTKPNNFGLSDFSAWQWELAITASRFELGLLSDDEIIAFTHKLMDKGFYDDVMLDIIDDDNAYPLKYKYYLVRKFTSLLNNLSLRISLENSANYLFSFSVFFPLTFRPNKTDDIFIKEIDEYIYQGYRNIILINADEIYENYAGVRQFYEIFATSNLNLYDEFIKQVNTFYTECEKWINRNEAKILEIMHQLFEDKK